MVSVPDNFDDLFPEDEELDVEYTEDDRQYEYQRDQLLTQYIENIGRLLVVTAILLAIIAVLLIILVAK